MGLPAAIGRSLYLDRPLADPQQDNKLVYKLAHEDVLHLNSLS